MNQKVAQEARAYLLNIKGLLSLRNDQRTVSSLVTSYSLSEQQAKVLIDEVLYGKKSVMLTRVETLQEVHRTHPRLFKNFVVDSQQQIPTTEGEWSLLDSLLERLMKHTILTTAKRHNLARATRFDYGADGRARPYCPRDAPKHSQVSETFSISNLSMSNKTTLLAALSHAGIHPVLKGSTKADCEFFPGKEALVNGKIVYGTGRANVSFSRMLEAADRARKIYLASQPLGIVNHHQPTIHLCRQEYDTRQPKLVLEAPGPDDAADYTFAFALAAVYCSEADILATLTFLLQRDGKVIETAEIFTEQTGKCAATAMVQSPDRHNRYANRLAVGLSCR